jgi:ferredoxin
MKNKNDDLKEKEVKKEDPLKQDKLENISGGRSWMGFNYIVSESICFGFSCKEPLPCVSACPHGAVKATLKPNPNEPDKNCLVAEINQDLCTGCGRCESQGACSHKGIVNDGFHIS